MATEVREFLESYDLYQRFTLRDGGTWRGEWPEVVDVPCRTCGERRAHRMWPSKVAGFSRHAGVYMIAGACECCGTDDVIFWVEVNQREGWMQKAGQLPATTAAAAPPVATASAS